MNLARVQYHMVKRAAGDDTQNAAPIAQAVPADQTPQSSQGPLQRGWNALKGAWQAGERTGKEVADSITKGWNESQSYAPAVQGALNQIERDPKSVIPEVQQAEQSGVFSNGLNSLINWYQQQQAAQAEAEKAARAARQARDNTSNRLVNYWNGRTNESALPRINEQSFQNPGAFNYSIPVDQLRGQQRQDPMGTDQQATNMEPAGYGR